MNTTNTQPDFRFETPRCPGCNGKAGAVTERILGRCGIEEDGAGHSYGDNGTEIVWDTAEVHEDAEGCVELHCAECRGTWKTRTLEGRA
jgi:hypothetical protein